MSGPILEIAGVSKTYKSGTTALHAVDLIIDRGEIVALLGPNGAGKTTLISIICGIVTASSGSIAVAGHDTTRDFRAARRLIGLVPQEIALDIFATVEGTVAFSRQLYGYPANPAHVEQVLRDLSLWDKRDAKIITLSGGMKRRAMIAKALAHEPQLLFLDEPTAGVDVQLRRDMWELVRRLRNRGTTVVLTTHYIEEAEEMADRIGVIDKGKLLLVEHKAALMSQLGKRVLDLTLTEPLAALPADLADWPLTLQGEGTKLRYTFTADDEHIPQLLARLGAVGIGFRDLETHRSTLEDIFVDLIGERA